MPIEFTVEEARALLALLDIAVKAGGLQVSEPATLLARKIEPAAQGDVATDPSTPDAA